MSSSQLLRNLLIDMKNLSLQINEFKFKQEDSFEELEQLQRQQRMLRSNIETVRQHHGIAVLPQECKTLIQDCMEIENRTAQKFRELKAEAAWQIQDIKNADFIRRTYQNDYIQSDGYFLDKQQ